MHILLKYNSVQGLRNTIVCFFKKYPIVNKYNTVKLGYNELGYNEQKKNNWLVQVIFMMVLPGYNEQNPVIMNKKRPKIGIFSTLFPSILKKMLTI